MASPLSNPPDLSAVPHAAVWLLDPLPDFLMDPGLAADGDSERLREFYAQWVQFIASLASWTDAATFGLRFSTRSGRTRIYLTCATHRAELAARLEAETAVLLRTHRLVSDAHASRVQLHDFREQTSLTKPALVQVRQQALRDFWKVPPALLNSANAATRFPWLTTSDAQSPPVVFSWRGPGGTFAIPFESLLSQPVACSITVMVQPTRLRAHEQEWLTHMAQIAQSKGEQNLQQIGSGAAVRVVDPAASLAGKLYMLQLSRLSVHAFTTLVICAADDSRTDVATSLAASVQSLVHEPPLDNPRHESSERLPSMAECATVAPNTENARIYESLIISDTSARTDLTRLSVLSDAPGAATVFRLPVSVKGGVPGVRVRQSPPDFHPGERIERCPSDCIQLGTFHSGGCAVVPVEDLTKHALITGFTGSGKTVTVLSIVHQLWVDHNIPFLVLESAKQEYRGLTQVEAMRFKSPALRVYTLGNELCAPFRLNPFELMPGIRVEAHLGKLQSCFEGAIPPIGPSASIISEALVRVYDDEGWSLTDVYPKNGKARRRFPTLKGFVESVSAVLIDRKYEGEVASNLQAALVGRFLPLLIGGKGRMFDCQRSSPSPQELFSVPTVLEMNDLMIEDKALMTMFLLTMLREYREMDRSGNGELKHVTLVEEAHNVLENVSSEGSGEGATKADTRYKAVQAFCSMLTEIRSLGEGLIIADQSPEKLARDAIRNTNLQIAHQLRDSDDREAIARAMIMSEEQQEFLGKLRPGQAAVFRTGLEKATFVQMDRYAPLANGIAGNASSQCRGKGFARVLSDEDLRTYMLSVDTGLIDCGGAVLPMLACQSCQSRCMHRDAVFALSGEPHALKIGREWFDLGDPRVRAQRGVSIEEFWNRGIRIAQSWTEREGGGREAAWCFFSHMWNRQSQSLGRKDDDDGLNAEMRDFFEIYWERTAASKHV